MCAESFRRGEEKEGGEDEGRRRKGDEGRRRKGDEGEGMGSKFLPIKTPNSYLSTVLHHHFFDHSVMVGLDVCGIRHA